MLNVPIQAPGDTSPLRGASREDALLLALEGVLRGTAPAERCSDGSRFELDLEASVTEGPLAGGRSVGAARFTIGRDGIMRLALAHTVAAGSEAITFDVRGFMDAAAGHDLERGGFPDVDYRFHGAAFVHAVGLWSERLEGAMASVAGWVNFESGEVRIEARM